MESSRLDNRRDPPGHGNILHLDSERVTCMEARGLQTEEIGCKCQMFFISLLSGRKKQTTSVRFFFPFSIQN